MQVAVLSACQTHTSVSGSAGCIGSVGTLLCGEGAKQL